MCPGGVLGWVWGGGVVYGVRTLVIHIFVPLRM